MPLEENPTVEPTLTVPEPVMPVPEAIERANSSEDEVNIFSPLAATTLFAKLATNKVVSELEDVKGIT